MAEMETYYYLKPGKLRDREIAQREKAFKRLCMDLNVDFASAHDISDEKTRYDRPTLWDNISKIVGKHEPCQILFFDVLDLGHFTRDAMIVIDTLLGNGVEYRFVRQDFLDSVFVEGYLQSLRKNQSFRDMAIVRKALLAVVEEQIDHIYKTRDVVRRASIEAQNKKRPRTAEEKAAGDKKVNIRSSKGTRSRSSIKRNTVIPFITAMMSKNDDAAQSWKALTVKEKRDMIYVKTKVKISADTYYRYLRQIQNELITDQNNEK